MKIVLALMFSALHDERWSVSNDSVHYHTQYICLLDTAILAVRRNNADT